MKNHRWIKSHLGHGNFQCEDCYITDKEADAIGQKFCDAPDKRRLLDGKPVPKNGSFMRRDPETGQQESYVVLSEEERSKGFVQPVRLSYMHETCGTVTTMGIAIAETYARNPSFYTSTFCVHCRKHFPVGKKGQFVWEGTNQKVGTLPPLPEEIQVHNLMYPKKG